MPSRCAVLAKESVLVAKKMENQQGQWLLVDISSRFLFMIQIKKIKKIHNRRKILKIQKILNSLIENFEKDHKDVQLLKLVSRWTPRSLQNFWAGKDGILCIVLLARGSYWRFGLKSGIICQKMPSLSRKYNKKESNI